MTDTHSPRWYHWVAIISFWATSWFVLAALVAHSENIAVLLAFFIIPIFALGIWAVAVPAAAVVMGFLQLFKRQWLSAIGFFLVPALGIAVIVAGTIVGDAVLAFRVGPLLIQEVERVKAGGAPSNSNGILSSKTMAFRLTGGFLDIGNGLLYDEAGQAHIHVPQEPGDRPSNWQANAVDIVSCKGGARRIYGKYYKISVSTYNC